MNERILPKNGVLKKLKQPISESLIERREKLIIKIIYLLLKEREGDNVGKIVPVKIEGGSTFFIDSANLNSRGKDRVHIYKYNLGSRILQEFLANVETVVIDGKNIPTLKNIENIDRSKVYEEILSIPDLQIVESELSKVLSQSSRKSKR